MSSHGSRSFPDCEYTMTPNHRRKTGYNISRISRLFLRHFGTRKHFYNLFSHLLLTRAQPNQVYTHTSLNPSPPWLRLLPFANVRSGCHPHTPTTLCSKN